ncbi:MAG TPA: hypothetical protein VE465_13870 [Streptosporangiaceae bacterium]|jgi:hypothetical protein|nr:hypothetical protein [Streptosporangiaceae bacterium]
MTCDPEVLGQALHAGFALGVLVGACAVSAVGSAGFGCWLLVQGRRRRVPGGPVEPPVGHPDREFRDNQARRDFEDMRAGLRRRRRLLRRGGAR